MERAGPEDDAALARRAASGDAGAFTALYRRHQGRIRRFALQMSGSEAIAKDVTQDVFLALVRDAGAYDPARGSLLAYLYGIARNHLLRAMKRAHAGVALDETYGGEEDDAPPVPGALIAEGDPLGALARTETIAAVRRAVTALPEAYREVVVLCELHELDYAEAARVMDCAIGTVRSRLHRARRLLVAKLRASRDAGAAGAGAVEAEPAGAPSADESKRCRV